VCAPQAAASRLVRMVTLSSGWRQAEPERAATALCAFDPELAAMRFDDASDDGQTEAGSLTRSAAGLPEAVEDVRKICAGMPGPSSRMANTTPPFSPGGLPAHGRPIAEGRIRCPAWGARRQGRVCSAYPRKSEPASARRTVGELRALAET